MTYRILAASLLSAAVLLTGCKAESTDAPEETAEPTATQTSNTTPQVPAATPQMSFGDAVVLKLDVNGMTCGGCVSAVTEAIASVDGVVQCQVDLDSNSATVHADSPEAMTQIIAAVVEAGFEANEQAAGS